MQNKKMVKKKKRKLFDLYAQQASGVLSMTADTPVFEGKHRKD